jgi:hypothetical protein
MSKAWEIAKSRIDVRRSRRRFLVIMFVWLAFLAFTVVMSVRKRTSGVVSGDLVLTPKAPDSTTCWIYESDGSKHEVSCDSPQFEPPAEYPEGQRQI